jgi:hypothetical protein
VTTNHNPGTFGQPVTFTVTVTNTRGNGTPTGGVEFFDGSTDLGPGSPLTGSGSSATSTFTTAQLSLGSHVIEAVYTATGGYLGGSGTLTQTVDAATTTDVSSNMSPSSLGEALTITATVTDTGTGATPTGRVVFFDGATRLGAGSTLAGSGAGAFSTFTTTHLSPGKHSIRAVFVPSGTFFGSSGSLTQAVDIATSTVVTSNMNPSIFGEALTFTVTVTGTGGGTPRGAVEFFDGSTDLGADSTLIGSGSRATSTITTSQLLLGSHVIEAVYRATGNFLGSSGTLTQTVDAAISPAVTPSMNPSAQGQALAFMATFSDTNNTPAAGAVDSSGDTTDVGAPAALSPDAVAAWFAEPPLVELRTA